MAACNGACLILSASRSASWSMLSRRTLSKVRFICMESSSSDMSRLSTTLSRVTLCHESPCEWFVVRVLLSLSDRFGRALWLRAGSLPLRERLLRGVEGAEGRSLSREVEELA